MLKKILLALTGILLVLCGVIMLQPDTYQVSRTAQIAAPPDKLFPYLNDLHNWDAWSPWSKLDPNVKVEYSGAPSGPGAIYYWTGNDKVGEGRMTITAAQPSSQIDMKLEFIKPFPSSAVVTFVVKPDAAGSSLEWRLAGDHNFMSKAMCLFMGGMDGMIGPDFEKGFAQLKSLKI